MFPGCSKLPREARACLVARHARAPAWTSFHGVGRFGLAARVSRRCATSFLLERGAKRPEPLRSPKRGARGGDRGRALAPACRSFAGANPSAGDEVRRLKASRRFGVLASRFWGFP